MGIRTKFIILILIIICKLHVYSKDTSYNEKRELARKIFEIQIKRDWLNLYISSSNNEKDIVQLSDKDLDYLNWNLNKVLKLEDIFVDNSNNSFSKKFIILKAANTPIHPTWYLLAISQDGNIYLLKNFEINQFNKLIRQKIGRPKVINEYIKICKLYINTVEYSDYGDFEIIYNKQNYKRDEKTFEIYPPKLTEVNNIYYFEFFSKQHSANNIYFHKFIFKEGLISSVTSSVLNKK